MDFIDIVHFIVTNFMTIILIIISAFWWNWQIRQRKMQEERHKLELESLRSTIEQYKKEHAQNLDAAICLQNRVQNYERERLQNINTAKHFQKTIENLEKEARELRQTTKNLLRDSASIKSKSVQKKNDDIDWITVLDVTTKLLTPIFLGIAAFKSR